MKYLNVFLFFCLTCFSSSGQNIFYKIAYSSIITIDAEARSTDVLYVNDKMTYYEIGKKKLIYQKIKSEFPIKYIEQKEKIVSFVYTDLVERKLYNVIENQNIYKTVEPLPVMNWVLTDETKEIEGVLLHKANVSFRGRNYEAWCNLNIPISTGPWKFNGAPGLIYEIKSLEEDYSYYWSLKEFKEITEDKKLKETLLLLTRKLDKDYTDLKTNVALIDEEDSSNEIISDIRLPEGMFIESIEVEKVDLKEMRRKRAEIKYEWEN